MGNIHIDQFALISIYLKWKNGSYLDLSDLVLTLEAFSFFWMASFSFLVIRTLWMVAVWRFNALRSLNAFSQNSHVNVLPAWMSKCRLSPDEWQKDWKFEKKKSLLSIAFVLIWLCRNDILLGTAGTCAVPWPDSLNGFDWRAVWGLLSEWMISGNGRIWRAARRCGSSRDASKSLSGWTPDYKCHTWMAKIEVENTHAHTFSWHRWTATTLFTNEMLTFSPVWTRMWRVNVLLLGNDFEQWGHLR